MGRTQTTYELLRVLDEVLGAIFEQEIMADRPETRQFLPPRVILMAPRAWQHGCPKARNDRGKPLLALGGADAVARPDLGQRRLK